jgi:hypothetical protein
MNLRVLLLVGSVALNAALFAAFSLRPALAPPALRGYFQRGAGAAEKSEDERTREQKLAAAKRASAEKPGTPAEIWSKLHSADLATLVSRLRAAGFPPSVVRAIVDAEVERQFSPRIKELTRSVNETPYWKPDPSYYMGNSKIFEEIGQIYRERSRVLRDLLGKDAYAWGGTDPTTAQRRQFGDLPAAKIDLVQRINDDYAEMMGQVRSAMQGVTLPEDREKLALLEREKRADLAGVLTPQELADYEMRTSMVTMRLRTAFTILDSSEQEFRTIYQIHDQFKEVLYPGSTSGGGFFLMGSETTPDKRREAGTQIQEQIKAALGPARYAEYQRATDNDFQQLYRLGQRDNVPYDTLVRAYDVRNTTTDAATKLSENASLDAAAKQAALKDLVQTARTQLLSTLGPATGPAYVQNSRWFTSLEQGRIMTVMPDGNTFSRSITSPPPRSAPAPKK